LFVLRLRQILFFLFIYLAMAVIGIGGLPLIVTRQSSMWVVKAWAHTVFWGARVIMGIEVEVRGAEHAPSGPALVAAKHQSMMDIVFPFTVFPAACFVLKQELMWAPILGWYAWRNRMIPVDRSAGAAALKKMVRQSRERLDAGLQIVIYPEGTRTAPGADADYKPGVAGLYRDLGDTPCYLVATNSGTCWPAKGMDFRPGKVVFQFLEPIPAGLKRGEFMKELQGRVETASKALL
jgi:1-acyl-sn-glycerol-3-phosphate acyltransferase